MDSCEIVKCAIEFNKPKRVPLMFPFLGVSDIHYVGLKNPKGWTPNFDGEDEWGVIWEKPNPASGTVNMGQPKNVVIADLDKIDSYKFPDPYDSSRYEDLEKEVRKAGKKYVLLGWFTLFERAQQLRGTENLFTDFYEKPQQVHKLLEKIKDFIIGALNSVERYKGDIHGFRIGDDWGDQKGLLISIKMFREFLKPLYEEIISRAHSLGFHVWLHSDGKINDLIQEFIDIGLDVVNIQSPQVLGIEEISKRYSGRITFECTVDLQKTLPFGSKEEVENEAKMLIHKWGTPQGGFIGTDYGATEEDHLAIGVSKERVQYMLEAFEKHGQYEEEKVE